MSPDPCKDLFVYGSPLHFRATRYLQKEKMLREVRLLLKGAEAKGVMSCQLPEIAYPLLGAQVRPPILF